MNVTLPQLTPAEHEAVTELVDSARRALGPHLHEARLFGSRARGEGSKDSDVDIAFVVTPEGRQRRGEIYDLAFDIGLERGVALAPFVISEDVLEGLKARERRLAADLEQEGIPL